MSRFEKTLFGGSRFIFWTVAPLLALCGGVLPFLISDWTATSLLGVSLTEALFLSLILGLYNPQRFRWATRTVTGITFCLFLAYVVEEVFLSGKNIEPFAGNRSDASPRNAIMGFIAIGLPCLWYTILGRFSFRTKDKPHGLGPDLLDKIDTLDIDI